MMGSKDPTCFQCYGISRLDQSGDYCLILQHMPLGPLTQNIHSISRMKWIEKVNLLFYIAYDLQLIHSLDIIHCNLNDGTILQYDINNAYINSFSLSLTVQEASIAKSELIGNLFHLAPEVFDEHTFIKASDIYSFGIIMWQISSERSISSEYGGTTTIYSHILKLLDGIRPTIREGTISCYSDLMKRCWDSDPTKRPSASKIFRILAKWKNDIAAFYESDPVDYNEDTENDLINIPVPLVNSTEPYEEELANELFENEIKKKSIKFIPWSELNDISKLDEGHFGFIFKAYWTKTHNNVVCKALINLKDINGKYYSAFIHELTMHTRTDLCENIVRFLGTSKDTLNDRYFLIMEYANDGNLRSYLKRNNNSLNWHQRLELACQITKGLSYLHSEEIIHRDLHDKNIVIQNGKAKITDFGNATSINTQTNIHNGLFGMISFLAPELLKPTKSDNVPYCKKTDIYSLGMIFWELSSGHTPFDSQPNFIILSINIIRGIREDTIPGTPEEYVNLYNKCWDSDPYERPDIEYVHKLLEGITKIWSNVSYITTDPEDNTSPQNSSEKPQSIELNDSKLLSLSVNNESEINYLILND
ncbi:kinase-like domain-containing protein [Gigaspora rosea]|uniref:Kinase-like domain-containing protein n=1 Tax=Gigaspora rosea TaxID=44941 RepID=A0A397VSI1_9GLOM|nr:kinase-like domain-containing protein [Gigaspora rosea]